MSSTKDEIILHETVIGKYGKIINRPSKTIKSPYVADVLLLDDSDSDSDTIVLGHTAALGCCGYVDKEQIVYMIPSKEGSKCQYTILQAIRHDITRNIKTSVGVAPKLAEYITGNALSKNMIDGLDVESFQREKKLLNSRFDFIGKTKSGTQFILEVKNVPLADFENIDSKLRSKIIKDTNNYSDYCHYGKIAYFPDGYRKKKTDTVSPRALKHIQELEKLKREYPTIQCILLFVIQRDDACCFEPANTDPIYKSALIKAHNAGVEVKTLQCTWKENKCYYINNTLPVIFPDT